MSEPDDSPELALLKAAFRAADEKCERISDALPSASEILAGAEMDWTELNQARAERGEIVEQLAALRAAARMNRVT